MLTKKILMYNSVSLRLTNLEDKYSGTRALRLVNHQGFLYLKLKAQVSSCLIKRLASASFLDKV